MEATLEPEEAASQAIPIFLGQQEDEGVWTGDMVNTRSET